MRTLALVALLGCLTTSSAFFHKDHACGDEDTRQHIRRRCRISLWKVDSLAPPSPSEAESPEQALNFEAAARHPDFLEAKKEANQCVMCVLHGFESCDAPLRDSGCGTPGLKTDEEHGETELSQSCLDLVESRNSLKQGFGPAFRMDEVSVEGAVTLVEGEEVEEEDPEFLLSLEELVAEVPTNALGGGFTRAAGVSAPAGFMNDVVGDLGQTSEGDDPTLTDGSLSNINELNNQEAAASRDDSTEQEKQEEQIGISAKREQSEPKKPYYLCAYINDTSSVDLKCPEGMALSDVLFASYGTPQTGDDSKALKKEKKKLGLGVGLAEIVTSKGETPKEDGTPIQKNGWVAFAGDRCYNTDFLARAECSAYNSKDVIKKTCKGFNKCGLKAVGNPKVFPMAFQSLTCDRRLALYVKLECKDKQFLKKSPVANAAAEARAGLSGNGDWRLDTEAEVTLDFDDPNSMDFLPGTSEMADGDATYYEGKDESEGEEKPGKFDFLKDKEGRWVRPKVRDQINPPTNYYVNTVLDGIGQVQYECADSGESDVDGSILIWAQDRANPEFTTMKFFDEKEVLTARWGLEDNTYWSTRDHSTVTPDAIPVGEVSDLGVTDGKQQKVENAPDYLWSAKTHTGSGNFSNVAYIQRYLTKGGVAAKSTGLATLKSGKQWYRCQNKGEIAQSKIQGTYLFYSSSPQKAEEPAETGLPAGAIAAIVGASLCVVFLIAGAIYIALKGRPGWMKRSNRLATPAAPSSATRKLQHTLLYDDVEEQNQSEFIGHSHVRLESL